MFQRILVPIDFTPKCREAIGVADRIARESDATVILLHVIDTIHADTGDGAVIEEIEEIQARCRMSAMERMEALAAELGDPAVVLEPTVVFGQRSKEQEIVEFAKTHEIDLIVLASHKIQPEETGRGIGTVSYKVGILAPCAIILVK
jgi:nucleotide-binding universal stress UspA family protein